MIAQRLNKGYIRLLYLIPIIIKRIYSNIEQYTHSVVSAEYICFTGSINIQIETRTRTLIRTQSGDDSIREKIERTI